MENFFCLLLSGDCSCRLLLPSAMIRRVIETFRLMIVAGEPSGDAHAAALVNALREITPGVQLDLFGGTGPLMRAAGVESVIRTDDLSILGLLEIGRALPKFWRAYVALKKAAAKKPPDAVILLDWPDFNLRLARFLHRRGHKIIYYISPQLWAWRSYRVRNIRRDVDLLLTILPFEPEWYAERSVSHVEFVGHPLAGEVRPRYGREEFCLRTGLDPSKPIVSLLPGSRHKELQRILPLMLDAVAVISPKESDVQFVLVVAPSRSLNEAREILRTHPSSQALTEKIRLIHHETREALAASDAAAVASGTATLEAALLETPMVIVYKESAVNWHTLGRLITADHFGLVNLIAGERLATELMQDDLTGDRLAAELLQLLQNGQNNSLRRKLHEVAQRLGEPGASKRAAQRILAAVRDWRQENSISSVEFLEESPLK